MAMKIRAMASRHKGHWTQRIWWLRREDILFGPIYSGKSTVTLIGRINSGQVAQDGDVVFFHAGGAVSLFAYENQFLALEKTSVNG